MGFYVWDVIAARKRSCWPSVVNEGAFAPPVRAGRMAQTAAHLVEGVMPWVPTRQWVVSVPIPLRYWTAPSRDLTVQVHRIIRTTIARFYVNQAVKRGAKRQNVQPGSVTFLQRLGGALQLNLHYHLIVIEGVFVDRTEQGLKPRFLKGEPPSDADVAHVVQRISRRVIRKLRNLGYLEADMEVPVATGYDALLDSEPELARTMAASVKQRIAFGERAGQRWPPSPLPSPRLASAKRYSRSTTPTPAWVHKRDVRSSSVIRPVTAVKSRLKSSPPSFPKPAVPRPRTGKPASPQRNPS